MKTSTLEHTSLSSARDDSPELFAELDKIINPEETEISKRIDATAALGEGVLSAANIEVRSLPNLAELGSQIQTMQERLDRLSDKEIFKSGKQASAWMNKTLGRLKQLSERDTKSSSGQTIEQLKLLGVHWNHKTEQEHQSPRVDSAQIEFMGLNGTFMISQVKSSEFASSIDTTISHINFEQTKKVLIEHQRMNYMSHDDQYESYSIMEFDRNNANEEWHDASRESVYDPGKNNRPMFRKRPSRKLRKLENLYVALAELAHEELDAKFEAAENEE